MPSLHMYVENEPAMKMNEDVLNDLPGELHTIKANNKIPGNCTYPFALIQAAQNQKQANTRGLGKLLKIKIGAKVILTNNIDMKDRLVNGQTWNIRHIVFAQGSVCKVWVKFLVGQAGFKATRSSYLGRQNS